MMLPNNKQFSVHHGIGWEMTAEVKFAPPAHLLNASLWGMCYIQTQDWDKRTVQDVVNSAVNNS